MSEFIDEDTVKAMSIEDQEQLIVRQLELFGRLWEASTALLAGPSRTDPPWETLDRREQLMFAKLLSTYNVPAIFVDIVNFIVDNREGDS